MITIADAIYLLCAATSLLAAVLSGTLAILILVYGLIAEGA
jgi:hypothetical protein